ncbi:unnamed protein product [Prorocentrum cordatum]|uniref:SET domain-containing protein n=1 Tax=Prorocentrum cordatum TaxID=2364126 RepID=A0ABN9STV9_9DINO|nr:unnamed protein product [Polarella glacialis]
MVFVSVCFRCFFLCLLVFFCDVFISCCFYLIGPQKLPPKKALRAPQSPGFRGEELPNKNPSRAFVRGVSRGGSGAPRGGSRPTPDSASGVQATPVGHSQGREGNSGCPPLPGGWPVGPGARGREKHLARRAALARCSTSGGPSAALWPSASAPSAAVDASLGVLLAYLRGDGGGLEVRASLIPGAGRGLFAARAFGEGDLLCVYSGTPVPLAQVVRREVSTDYLMGGFGLYSVDASAHPEVLARYINDHPEGGRRNARFVKLKQQRRALVLASRAIAAGEEIYAGYGEGYWRARPGAMAAAGGAEAAASTRPGREHGRLCDDAAAPRPAEEPPGAAGP